MDRKLDHRCPTGAVHSGAAPFFGMRISELKNRTVALDLLWGDFATSLEDRLWSGDAAEEQLAVLEHALQEKARQPLVRHPAVFYAMRKFEHSRGAHRVEEVADELGMSPRRSMSRRTAAKRLIRQNVLGARPISDRNTSSKPRRRASIPGTR